MTSENAKVAYDNAIRDNDIETAVMILKRHPEFKEIPKEETISKRGRPKKESEKEE